MVNVSRSTVRYCNIAWSRDPASYRTRAAFLASGSSYLNVTLTTVRHLCTVIITTTFDCLQNSVDNETEVAMLERSYDPCAVNTEVATLVILVILPSSSSTGWVVGSVSVAHTDVTVIVHNIM